jgi:predicted cupin superfamily sugar epimerase
MTAADWIARLGLLPHPEGGFFKETYRAGFQVTPALVKEQAGAPTSACTSIHYLLQDADYSGFHRIAYPEIWYFHDGAPLTIHEIDQQGRYSQRTLGRGVGEYLSLVVEPGVWFAADLPSKQGYALVSCAVAPAFDFALFEMAKREAMLAQYPRHAEVLRRLCRE